MRDLKKMTDDGKAKMKSHSRIGLTASELDKLYKEYLTDKADSEGDAVFNLIDKAFNIGVAIGARL